MLFQRKLTMVLSANSSAAIPNICIETCRDGGNINDDWMGVGNEESEVTNMLVLASGFNNVLQNELNYALFEDDADVSAKTAAAAVTPAGWGSKRTVTQGQACRWEMHTGTRRTGDSEQVGSLWAGPPATSQRPPNDPPKIPQ